MFKHYVKSIHDKIFRNLHRLNSKEFGQILVITDSGYENSNVVITPVLRPVQLLKPYSINPILGQEIARGPMGCGREGSPCCL